MAPTRPFPPRPIPLISTTSDCTFVVLGSANVSTNASLSPNVPPPPFLPDLHIVRLEPYIESSGGGTSQRLATAPLVGVSHRRVRLCQNNCTIA